MTNLDSILKGRDITLPTEVCLVKVVMYGCESWTIKKAECWRIDAFELRCWRRLLRVPWTARRSNQSIIKEISPEYSLDAETPILWPPDAKNGLIWKDPDAAKDWRQEEKGMTEDEMVGWQRWLNGHELSKLKDLVMDRGAWRAAIHGVTKSQTRLSNWTKLNWTELNWNARKEVKEFCCLFNKNPTTFIVYGRDEWRRRHVLGFRLMP